MTVILTQPIYDKHFPNRIPKIRPVNDLYTKEQVDVVRLAQCVSLIEAMFATMKEMPTPDALFILEKLYDQQTEFIDSCR